MVHHYKCKFGKGKSYTLNLNGDKITQTDRYCYLRVKHKSGKVKYAVEDRIKRASRAKNMLQGALATYGNVNVKVAMSLLEKQMVPILTYGSVIWGISGCYNRMYIENIPESVNSVDRSRNL